MTKATSWTDDLVRLRSGELSFDAYVRRHRGILRRLATKWSARCPKDLPVDDAAQEVLVEVWRSVDSWEEGKMSLAHWVRARVRFRLWALTDKLIKDRAREQRYLWTWGRRDDGVSDGALPLDVVVDAGRRFALVVGSLSPRAADLVYEVAQGGSLGEVSSAVYFERTSGGALKQGRLAVREALRVAGRY